MVLALSAFRNRCLRIIGERRIFLNGGRLLASLILLLPPALFIGCAGYTLGPTNGQIAGEHSVQIVPFSNQTLEPRLGDALTAQLRKQLQHDGTYRLATHGDGDILVSGVLTVYHRDELSFVPTDILTVRDYRLVLKAQVTARDRITGKVLFENHPVSGTTLIRVGSDLVSTERQAMPLLAGDLAKNITSLLVDGRW